MKSNRKMNYIVRGDGSACSLDTVLLGMAEKP